MMLAALALVAAVQADPETVSRAQEIISERMGEEIEARALDRAAVAGMAQLLDEQLGTEGNRVLTIPERANDQAWMQGRRSGIGVEYRVVAGRGLVITAVFDDGPGARAGLEVGDLVVGVNSQPFTGQPSHEIHQYLQAAIGEKVNLDVRHPEGMVRSVSVPRGTYRVPPVIGVEDAMRPVLRITFFGEDTAKDVTKALGELDPGQGLVLDLRDNEGGLLSEVVAVADAFLDSDQIAVHEGMAEGKATVHRTSLPRSFDGRLVVLVNRGTAGPAEALAACLQYHRAATVVGTPTSGQANLPTYHPLGDGLILRLTDIRLAGPDGRSWQGEGIRPDLLVEATSMSLPPLDSPGADTDLQRETALGLLRKASSP